MSERDKPLDRLRHGYTVADIAARYRVGEDRVRAGSPAASCAPSTAVIPDQAGLAGSSRWRRWRNSSRAELLLHRRNRPGAENRQRWWTISRIDALVETTRPRPW